MVKIEDTKNKLCFGNVGYSLLQSTVYQDLESGRVKVGNHILRDYYDSDKKCNVIHHVKRYPTNDLIGKEIIYWITDTNFAMFYEFASG